MRVGIIGCVLAIASHVSADPAAPCFEESTRVFARIGIGRNVSHLPNTEGSAPIGELEVRRWVSPRGSVSGVISHTRFQYDGDNYGTKLSIDHAITHAGVRLGAHLHPKFAIGFGLGFMMNQAEGLDVDTPGVAQTWFEYGQYGELFADITVVELGSFELQVGGRTSAGEGANLSVASIGIGWIAP